MMARGCVEVAIRVVMERRVFEPTLAAVCDVSWSVALWFEICEANRGVALLPVAAITSAGPKMLIHQ